MTWGTFLHKHLFIQRIFSLNLKLVWSIFFKIQNGLKSKNVGLDDWIQWKPVSRLGANFGAHFNFYWNKQQVPWRPCKLYLPFEYCWIFFDISCCLFLLPVCFASEAAAFASKSFAVNSKYLSFCKKIVTGYFSIVCYTCDTIFKIHFSSRHPLDILLNNSLEVRQAIIIICIQVVWKSTFTTSFPRVNDITHWINVFLVISFSIQRFITAALFGILQDPVLHARSWRLTWFNFLHVEIKHSATQCKPLNHYLSLCEYCEVYIGSSLQWVKWYKRSCWLQGVFITAAYGREVMLSQVCLLGGGGTLSSGPRSIWEDYWSGVKSFLSN